MSFGYMIYGALYYFTEKNFIHRYAFSCRLEVTMKYVLLDFETLSVIGIDIYLILGHDRKMVPIESLGFSLPISICLFGN